jgi:hypothetical protein
MNINIGFEITDKEIQEHFGSFAGPERGILGSTSDNLLRLIIQYLNNRMGSKNIMPYTIYPVNCSSSVGLDKCKVYIVYKLDKNKFKQEIDVLFNMVDASINTKYISSIVRVLELAVKCLSEHGFDSDREVKFIVH